MDFYEILGKLNNVDIKGDSQAYARCPAHNDQHNSLSIGVGDNKRILLHCHAGCTTDSILSAIGLTTKDLFPNQSSLQKSWKKRVCSYDYTDESGTFLNQKTRWIDEDGNKSFSWSHKEDGEWKKGRNGRKVLYNLPAVIKADTVYLVEGEKDVETLKSNGLTATTAPDGAGTGKWSTDYDRYLSGKSVIVIPDNDEIGRNFSEKVARSVSCVATVTLLDLREEWPTLKEHGDITDLIEQYGAETVLKKLSSLIQNTSVYNADDQIQRPSFFDGNTFLFNVMADYLVRQHGACKIHDVVHVYDDGIYKPGEAILHGHMIKLVPRLSDARRREVFKYIKISLDTPVKEVSPPHLIPFRSKIYDIQHDCFINYSPEYVFLNRFPYNYDPEAPAAPLVDATINAIAGENLDVVALILEAFGNCFYLLNAYRGTVMFYGQSGNNGKSTLLNMLLQMIGRENASFLTLQDMAERFRLIDIYGKAINVCDDNGDQFISDSSVFKRVSTGGTVTAEKKGQDAISFVPFAKCFFAMNSLPAVSDKSKAYFSRLLLIPLNADFSKSGDKDVSLKDRKWTDEEMAYLTRLSMEGLKRLIAQGDFTRPECVTNALEQYEIENNPVLAFLEDHNVIQQPTATAYQQFRNWCMDNGHKPVTQTKFSREVCKRTGLTTGSLYVPAYNSNARCFVKG